MAVSQGVAGGLRVKRRKNDAQRQAARRRNATSVCA